MAATTSTLDRARQALSCSPIVTLQGLQVEQNNGSLIITGRVRSYYEKQMAQEAIRAVCENVQLKNIVDVRD